MPDETEVKYAILKSPAGLSILDRKNNPNLPFKEFLPSENDAKKTAEILRKKGFEVIYIGLLSRNLILILRPLEQMHLKPRARSR
jgi:hypothetical protein